MAAGSTGSADVTKAVTLAPTAGGARADAVLTSTAGVARALVVDCTWIDRDGDGVQDHDEAGGVTAHVVSFVDGGARFSTTVAGAPNGSVCDRAVLLALTSSQRVAVAHTNVACAGRPPPVVPGSTTAVLLGATSLAVVTVLVLRRRRLAAP